MRVLIFSLEYFPRVGGAEIAIKELTDRLSDEFVFDMVTWGAGPAEERVGVVSVYRITGAKWLYPVRAFRKASSLHKAHPFDLTWSMMAAYAGFAGLLFKLRRPQVPWLLSLQEGDPISHIKRRTRFVYPLFRMIFRRADVVQAISTYLADFGKSMGHAGYIEVVPNGVDTRRFSWRARFINPDHVVLVTASRLVYKNGVDIVIRALPLLPASVIFRVYGEGPLEGELRELAKALGVAERVAFKGFVSHDELPRLLSEADIFVRPSRSEGMGNSFIEAMAAGLPVIATQQGGIADFLFDENRNQSVPPTGFAVDPDSPAQIAQQVRRAITQSEATGQVVKNARALVMEKYDWDHVARLMRGVLERTAKRARMGV